MERNEMIDILNGMCERCLMEGVITTLNDAKILCEVFDRFRNSHYTNDVEYSKDIIYLYKLAVKLHENRSTTLEESYSIYSAILAADRTEFIEFNEPTVVEEIVEVAPVKIKKNKNSKVEDGVVDVSEIMS